MVRIITLLLTVLSCISVACIRRFALHYKILDKPGEKPDRRDKLDETLKVLAGLVHA